MNNNGKPKKKLLTTFDIVLITVVVLIAALILGWKAVKTSPGEREDSGSVNYYIELVNMVENSANSICQGDELIETVKNTPVGTVKSVEITNTIRWSDNLKDGGRKMTEIDLKTALIEIEASCIISDSTISTKGGGIELRVGREIGVSGPGYSGKGYIVAIERE
jgi:hypothetical protein